MSDYLIVFITAATMDEAKNIAAELIHKRLAACVNIVPQILSIYRWKGEICRETEVLLIAKTHRERYSDLEQAVKHGHSYEVPEVIALPLVTGSESYLKWLSESVTPGEGNM